MGSVSVQDSRRSQDDFREQHCFVWRIGRPCIVICLAGCGRGVDTASESAKSCIFTAFTKLKGRLKNATHSTIVVAAELSFSRLIWIANRAAAIGTMPSSLQITGEFTFALAMAFLFDLMGVPGE